MSDKYWDEYPLLRTMTKLRNARFKASERLSRRYKWHSLALVVFSIYVIALTILPNFFRDLSSYTLQIVSYVSAVSSVFVVALSMYLAFSEDVVRAKHLHDNAKKVTNLYNRYRTEIYNYANSNTNEKIDNIKYEQMYSEIMDTCPYNHDPIDFNYAMLSLEKISIIRGASTRVSEFLSVYLWPMAAFTLPPVAIFAGLKLAPIAM